MTRITSAGRRALPISSALMMIEPIPPYTNFGFLCEGIDSFDEIFRAVLPATSTCGRRQVTQNFPASCTPMREKSQNAIRAIVQRETLAG
jgi:hypothetical protein